LSTTTGLLVMHYGTPATLDDVLPYYTHIRRGRPPSDEQLQNLTERYIAIGGPSPLAAISLKQAEGIQSAMQRRGVDARLYMGAKHAPVFVADAVKQMAEDGIENAVGIVLAPHFSSFSVAAYEQSAFTSRDQNAPSMRIEMVQRWGALPEFISALAHRVNTQLEDWDKNETLVILSAHSLPEKIVAAGDPYPEELMETSRLVAEACGLPHWTFAYQSASTTGDPWLGPDILNVITENKDKYKNVIACAVGFVSDHLEVMFDLGVEARDKCAELGLNFRRAATIADDPKVMDALGGLCAELLTQG
jgi:ferrochelatase